YNREIFFSCEESLFELSEDELSKNSSEAIFSIAQENATNDLKYGNGLSEWKFFRSGEFICLEILSNTNYNLEEAGKGRGEENIILRLNEIGGKMENLGNNQKFHVIYYFTQNT
ncbi:MAG: hypothetical protein KDK36_14115, partial [Leptospiraceae bacterium]|nr:hypothetical protein [Leptospiraceae bacterium]